MRDMEQLIAQVEQYATARGIKPATVLQYAAGLSGSVWDKWLAGSSCNMATAERIRTYIVENPVLSGSPACPNDVATDTDTFKGAAE